MGKRRRGRRRERGGVDRREAYPLYEVWRVAQDTTRWQCVALSYLVWCNMVRAATARGTKKAL